eukprot:CAMPEP_0194316510 /NCGR_PEP_ID=MMETSP0171-20130528/13305_1 /TAXON_ID=218684 /ORGANISM="Corethron pennatum, Strain L29A3" /LENGTH=296 /DNA_ID=CAMNT_0039072771 /DNA_START=55 /DNA_END=941 /DNA_ORIENTATION=+
MPMSEQQTPAPVSAPSSAFQIACVDVHAPDAPEHFTRSLRTIGFAVLKVHPIDFDVVRTLYAEWRALFHALDRGARLHHGREQDAAADSREERLFAEFLFRADTQDGYFPLSMSEQAKGASTKDIKHYYHCYFPDGRFPHGHVSDGAKELFRQVMLLSATLLDWIEADIRTNCSSGLVARLDDKLGGRAPRTKTVPLGGQEVAISGCLADCVGPAQTLLRVLHYPAYDDAAVPAGAVRAAAHEDINLITILPSGSARGLQVWDPDAKEWLQVPAEDDCIIVNVGDMLQELTQREYV